MEASVLRQGLRVLRRGIADEPRIFALATAGGSMFGLATVASAFVAGAIVGKVIEPSLADHHVPAGALGVVVAVLFAVATAKVIGILGRRIGAGAMQYRLQARYRRQVTGRYLELPVSWHQQHATGTLLSNANADVEAAWYPIAPLPFAVATIVMLGVAVGSLFVVDWALALVGLAVFPALFTVNFWYGRRIAPRMARVQALRGELSAAAHESFDGALVVKTMGREAHETERFAARADELRDAQIAVGRVRGLFDPLLDALPMLGTLAAMVVGGLRVRGGAVDVPDVISVAFLFSVLAVPVRAIGWVLADAPRAAVGWERVSRVLSATGEMRYGTETPAGDDAVDLSFDGVGYAYPGAAPVLSDVTFKVPAGATVALVGPTGSGKSTIASLAARLIDPDHGGVTVGGHDVKALSAAALAATVALVPQVPFVFDDSVAGNVALERDGIDDEAVRRALAVAQADRFVAALPDGIDTMVGERGTTLSGGQRQRLTLARALAGSPRLLVIDDATSAVDPRVEAAILAALRGGSRQAATILVVAYRRATISLADLVVYLDRGRVVATGPHEQLLKTVPGYASLVTAYETETTDAETDFDREAVA